MFKKIICFIAAISLLFAAGCEKEDDTPARKHKNKPKVVEQPVETSKPKKDGWTSDILLLDLNRAENADASEGTYEINENEYDISIALSDAEDGEHFEKINVTVNGAESSVDSLGCYKLLYAAAAELDGEDLIIFAATTGEDDWSVLTAMRYNGESLEPLRFSEGEVSDMFLPLSHMWSAGIALGDGSSFGIWRETTSTAMWQTKRTCTVEDDKITELEEDKYETNTKEFLTPKIDYDTAYFSSEEEYNRLWEGYALCYKDYDFLKAGEYFTLLYDDGNNNIYVKTDSGEEGWIQIPDDYSGYEISPWLLYLAG